MDLLISVWPWVELAGRLLAVVMTFVLIRSRKDPRAMLAWIMSFFLLPFLGPAFYFLFGEPRLKLRAQARARRKQLGPGMAHEGPVQVPDEPLDALVHHMLASFNPFPPRPGNDVWMTSDGEAFFANLFEAIAAAKERVHLEFYLIRNDATGKQLRELLKAKADEGVEVRLLYDHVGSLFFHRAWLELLQKEGIRISPFLPINLLRRQFHINFRNHRKIVTIDGKVAYTGGVNIGDEYRTGDSAWGRWRDLGIRVKGPAVRDLDRIFLDDWQIATGEQVQPYDFPPAEPDGTLLQVVPGGPDDPYEPIELLFTTLMSRVNSSLMASTPYFIPDSTQLHLLQAARMRGAHVDLALPAVGNHWWVHRATESFTGDLLSYGIRPWIYKPGMLHTKAMVCDERIALAGSPNLDVRSFRLNFEVALLFYDDGDVAVLKRELDAILRNSELLTDAAYQNRSRLDKLTSGIARAFGPVL